jgi:polyphosphate kinase
MQTSPRTHETRRRGPNGRFLPRSGESNTVEAAPVTTEPVETVPVDLVPAQARPAFDETRPAFDEIREHVMTEEELPEDRFLNRELSWLDFNARVLALAEDPETPLLERAKFLAIFSSNLDEFYMVRVAGLKRRLSAGLPMRGGDRVSLRGQLEMISARAADLVTRHAACFTDEVRPKLSAEGIELVSWGELDAPERERLRTYFREQVFPVLTPLAVDPAHPFPYI